MLACTTAPEGVKGGRPLSLTLEILHQEMCPRIGKDIPLLMRQYYEMPPLTKVLRSLPTWTRAWNKLCYQLYNIVSQRNIAR